jgi:hypothetical protein
MFDRKPKTNEEIEAEWRKYIEIKRSLERDSRNGQI